VAKKNATANGVLKKKDLKRFRDGLAAVISSGKYEEFKFSYAVVKTHRLVETELRDLAETNKPSDEYQEFEKKRQELVMKYAKKDKDGKPMTFVSGGMVKAHIDDTDACNAAVDELKKKYEKAVKEQEEKDAKFEKFREEPADVKIHAMPEDAFPKNMTSQHLSGIFEMIA
jgi:FtsZ-binding cell division protein ZapB